MFRALPLVMPLPPRACGLAAEGMTRLQNHTAFATPQHITSETPKPWAISNLARLPAATASLVLSARRAAPGTRHGGQFGPYNIERRTNMFLTDNMFSRSTRFCPAWAVYLSSLDIGDFPIPAWSRFNLDAPAFAFQLCSEFAVISNSAFSVSW